MPAWLAMRPSRSPCSAANTRPVLPPDDQPSQLKRGMERASASSSTASACAGAGRAGGWGEGEGRTQERRGEGAGRLKAAIQ